MPVIRHLAAAALAVTALLLAACSAGSSAGPLTSGTLQEGILDCFEVPNPYPASGAPSWDSPIGYAIDWYFNSSGAPVEIESVSLIDPHNLVLHQSVVYQGRKSQHSIVQSDGWQLMGQHADSSAWARRQSVPGAVIPPQAPGDGTPGPDAAEYAVVVEISAKTSAGGYAIGQQVTYKQGNDQHTIRSYTGYVIAPPGPNGDGRYCNTPEKAVSSAWKKN